MSIEEENKKIIRLVFEELGKGNLEVIDEYFSEDFKRYASDGQEMDKDGYKQNSNLFNKDGRVRTILASCPGSYLHL